MIQRLEGEGGNTADKLDGSIVLVLFAYRSLGMGIVGDGARKKLVFLFHLIERGFAGSNTLFESLAFANQNSTGFGVELAFHFLGILIAPGPQVLNLLEQV
ncbi:hypothetical protein SDC9_179799 [bioreactor metagenome]|uniref:Uncharacterized protein n=1 Tax=bioreactor metagenome TaxID=1076179 RepID=A0A645GZT9_9ZZZZ